MAANQPARPGFIHNGLIVYALQYTLATEPVSWLIVWLDEQGRSLRSFVRAADGRRRIVTLKPGDTLLHKGTRYTITAVSIFRALGVRPGREVVG